MKKTVSINLGGLPFIIDEDAYLILNDYLDTIEHHFVSSPGCEDIVADIESRMAELFTDKLNKSKIINIDVLDEVITIMGRPEDFGAEPIEGGSKQQYDEPVTIRTGKKLFRDKDHSMIGGVVAGVAAYFGIDNVLILRLLWLFAILFGGIGLGVYLILWVVLPVAKTTADKLSMRGEPINIENIGHAIEKEMEELSKTFNTIAGKFSKSKP